MAKVNFGPIESGRDVILMADRLEDSYRESGWTWVGVGVPNSAEIAQTISRLWQQALGHKECETGGLLVRVKNGRATLFVDSRLAKATGEVGCARRTV
jgi:hypothetical protein